MKLKMLTVALVLGGSLVAGNAAAIVVGDVNFGVLGDNPTNKHLETTTIAETVVLSDGDPLTAYGVVSTVNGLSSYTDNGDKLYFVASNYITQNFTATTTDFSGGRIEFFLGPEFNLLNQDSPTNVNTISNTPATYSEWVAVEGHTNTFSNDLTSTLQATGTLTGTTISFNGQGLLDIVNSFGLGEVQAFLNGNDIADLIGGLADIAFTTSSNNFLPNPNDTCSDTPTAGQWCLQGSADIRGSTIVAVPEPSIMALMGIGLIGVGAASARRKKARKA